MWHQHSPHSCIKYIFNRFINIVQTIVFFIYSIIIHLKVFMLVKRNPIKQNKEMHQSTPVQLQIKASKTKGIKDQEDWQNTFSTYNSSFNKRKNRGFFVNFFCLFLPLMLVSYKMSVFIPHKRYYFHRKNGIPLLTINRFHFQT